MRQNGEGSFGQWHYSSFCFLAEWPAFTVDQEPPVLPEDVFFSQASQLRDAQPSIVTSRVAGT